MKLTDKSWAEFLEWLEETKQVSLIWKPHITSIRLWLEFEKSKK